MGEYQSPAQGCWVCTTPSRCPPAQGCWVCTTPSRCPPAQGCWVCTTPSRCPPAQGCWVCTTPSRCPPAQGCWVCTTPSRCPPAQGCWVCTNVYNSCGQPNECGFLTNLFTSVKRSILMIGFNLVVNCMVRLQLFSLRLQERSRSSYNTGPLPLHFPAGT